MERKVRPVQKRNRGDDKVSSLQSNNNDPFVWATGENPRAWDPDWVVQAIRES